MNCGSPYDEDAVIINSNGAKETYTGMRHQLKSAGVYTKGGCAVIEAKHSLEDGVHSFENRQISTYGTMKFKYGYLEIRAKLPQHPTATAFWSGGDKSSITKASMELDLLETISNTADNDKTILTNIHSWDSDTTQKQSLDNYSAEKQDATEYCETLPTEFHTYAFEWDENEINFYLDGNCYYSFDINKSVLSKKPNGDGNADTFRQAIDLRLSSTMGLGYYGPIWTVGDPEKTELLIDYVRLYQKPSDGGELIVKGKKQNINEKLIAFTFDDGPNGYLSSFTKLFSDNDAAATFFLIGNNINDSYKSALENAVACGMELGNHSNTHTRMTTLTSSAEIAADFRACNEKVKNLIGYDMKIARLPNLAGNATVYEAMRELGLPCFHSVYTYGKTQSVQDWDGSFTPEQIYQAIKKTYYDGAIYCCHVTDRTLEAMKRLLPELAQEGYRFVTVSELMKSRGYEISDLPFDCQIMDAALTKAY